MSLPTFIFALLVVSCAVAAPRALAVRELAGNDAIAVEAAMVSRHEKWMAEHGRTYADEEEKARRLEVFLANAKFIDSFNALTVSSGEHGLEGHGRRHRRQGPRLLRYVQSTRQHWHARYCRCIQIKLQNIASTGTFTTWIKLF